MLFRTHAPVESASASVSRSTRATELSGVPHERADLRQATLQHRQLVLRLCIAMVVATLVLLPFARMPVGRIAFFFPAYQTAVILSCLITTYLMYAHFRATRAVSLLHLSAGYLYTGGVLFMQCLPQQGAFIPNERLLGSSQSAIWLWVFWHLGPALSVLYFAWSHHRKPGLLAAPGEHAVRNTATSLLAAMAATALLVFALIDWLPVLDVAEDFSRITTTGIAPGIELLLAVALLVLWRASRFRNVLHLWLGIVVVALLCDNAITMLAGSRLTLGWYAGRIGALLGLSVMTMVYLQELKHAYLASLVSAEQLVKADQRKDEFLAMLAHELRNPLAPISSAAELLGLGNLSREDIHKTSIIITRQAKHMVSLVDDLLDVSRVNGGFVELDCARVDIKQVIADAVEQVRPLIDAHRHRLSIQLMPEPSYVTGDHKRLVQVVANLLSNSTKFTPVNGHISVRLQASEAHIVIGVADDGIGISVLLLADVFKVFVQGKRILNRAQGGLGLGLAIVKSLVELHGGSASAQSQGDGKGSEFMVRLPRLFEQSDASPRHTDQTSAAQPATRAGATIMVVDDNVDAAEMLGAFLKAKGFCVTVEYDANGALKKAAEKSFDAFFLDIGMPGMDGLQLVQRLRTLPQAKNKLMVAVTGYGSAADKVSFSASGFDERLVKPATPEKILEVLEKISHR
jgi:signal transduction histidine kinase/ActR/RegA family two-component response regulator